MAAPVMNSGHALTANIMFLHFMGHFLRSREEKCHALNRFQRDFGHKTMEINSITLEGGKISFHTMNTMKSTLLDTKNPKKP